MAAYNSLSDLQLVDLLKEDDEAAFTEIYGRYADKLTVLLVPNFTAWKIPATSFMMSLGN